jgi:hypothetical protein
MVVQYGFVVLFIGAQPLAPLLALANNVAEIHIDAYKLCFLCKRPIPAPANSIGAWGVMLQTLSVIAVATNCGEDALSFVSRGKLRCSSNNLVKPR